MTEGQGNAGEHRAQGARGVERRFQEGSTTLEVLRGLNLEVRAGERLSVIGASGSGKTTLLQILGRPRPARRRAASRSTAATCTRSSEPERGALRNRTIGFVYQFHHLLAEFSALENVAMPLLVRRMSAAAARQRRERAAGARGSGRRA